MGTKLFGCPSLFPVPFLTGLLACALLLCSPALLQASPASLDFTTLRLGSGDRAVLIIGGIQGDEPGGFSAATLLATRYDIRKGSVWVVPNLNFPSIIQRSRGLHGDMNRKFA
ncbi:MAG: deacylase, partial [Desulfovibrio sp.]|nr:deacylase [Desulfovibrio sp.]